LTEAQRAIAFVEANRTGNGRLILEKCRRFSVIPHVLTRAPESYPKGYLDAARVVVIDTTDPAAVLQVCEEIDPVGVWSTSDLGIEVATEVAARLGLIGPDPQAVRLCRDKARQHAVMRATDVPVPATVVIEEDAADHCEAVNELACPLVVKPSLGTGSMHVRSFVDSSDALAYAEALLGETGEGVLVQEQVEGPEFSVEVLEQRPVAVMRKYLSEDDLFVEVGHDCLGVASSAGARDLVGSALAAIHSLGLTRGPAHVELRRGPSGPVLIEVNPRLAGGQIPIVVKHGLGIDMVSETLRWLLGGRPRLHPIRETGAAVRFLLAEQAGTLAGVEGTAAAEDLPGIVEVDSRAPGSPVQLGDFRQRVAHLIASGEDGDSAGRVAEQGLALLDAEVTAATP
jgi:biotin carboxylase